MMQRRLLYILTGLLPLLLLSACDPNRFQVEPGFGAAVHANETQQTIYPQGVPVSGPQGLDGASARAVIERYVAASISPPAQSSSFSVGLGSAGSTPMTVPAALGTTP